MSYLFDLLSIAAAIFLVVKIQQLRSILALPIARHDTKLIPAPPEEERDPVFAELEHGFALLGFGEPAWIESRRKDGEPTLRPLSAAFPTPDGGWVRASAPISVLKPHTPLYYFAHKLADGRTAVSQPFDIYFEMVQCESLVARTARETTLESQWRAHTEWLRSLGSEVVALPESELIQAISEFEVRLHRDLVASGKARELSENLAVFRLGTAIRVLWNFARIPKPKPDKRPVPASRLADLAMANELVCHRSPPRDVQLGLFALSAALFMAAGWLVWKDPWAALVILVVVLVHELGHFLAMRAFGYRNVHIMALPLVGGVTIGQDAAPSASKRAWMSLMGPLPGILIGWGLLWLVFSGHAGVPHLIPLAATFLTLNYLNILPFPPLDGAHVVEAMLPARWAKAQTVFVGVAALVGAALAMYFNMPILVFLALLQLLTLKGRWQAHAAESVFPRLRLPTDRRARLQEIFRILEGRAGAAVDARARVSQGIAVAHRLDVRPMGVLAMLATGLVYATLLAVPVAALAYVGWTRSDAPVASTENWRVVEAQRVQWRKEAKSASYRELVAELAGDDPRSPAPQPASAQAFEDTEARLHRPIPDDLRAFYETADGLPGYSIASLEQLREPSAEELDYASMEGRISVPAKSGRSLELPKSEAAHWWILGGPDSTVFYLPDPDRRLPGVRVVDAWMEDPTAHASLRGYLEMLFVGSRETKYFEAQHASRLARAKKQLANAAVPKLMSAWPKPGLMSSLLGKGWRGSASEAELDSAQERIGMPLPEDLRQALQTHDGFPPLDLLSASELETVEAKAPDLDRQVLVSLPKTGQCTIVAARHNPNDTRKLVPTLLWCPGNSQARWLALPSGNSYDNFQQWLFEHASNKTATGI